jgi:tetratricopeptide (TPR) repeat protein
MLPALLALAITFLAFLPSLSNQFVNWDDNLNVYENKSIETLDLAHVKAIFTNTVIGGYNPLTILTFAIERHFVGLSPKLYHIDNLLLHLMCVALAFVFLRMLKISTWAAVFGALLFGVHPMRVESVAWVTERKDVLYSVFYLGALVAYVRFLQTNFAKKYYFIALVLFALALFAKIQAVALPLSFLALDYFFKRPLRLKLVLEKIPFFLMSLAVGCIGVFLLSKSDTLKDDSGFGLFGHLLIGAYSYCVYLIKAVVPYVLCPVYPYPATLSPIFYIAPTVVLAVVAALWFLYRRGNRAVVFGFAFFTVNIVFVLQILGAGQGFIADRFPYIAYLGLFFLAAKYFDSLREQKEWRAMVQYAAIAIVAIFAFVTWKQCAIWKDGDTLWTAVTRRYPNDPFAYGQRAYYLRSQAAKARGDDARRLYAASLNDYDRAAGILDAAPGFVQQKVTVHNSRGKTLFDMGRTPEAIAEYTKAIDLDPNFAEARINRGAAYGKLGKTDLALADFNKGVELKPENSNGYFNRSILYAQMSKFDLAVRDYDIYLTYEPNNVPVLYERAMAKRKLGRHAEAIEDYNQILRIDPNQPDIYLERSRTFRDLGKRAEALSDAKIAKASGLKVDDLYMQQLQQ